LTNSQIEV